MKNFLRCLSEIIRNRAGRFTAFLLCMILAAAALPANISAAETAGTDRIVILVGWYDSSFNSMDSHRRRSGYAYEYQMKIAAYTGWEYEYVPGSWPELMEMLKNGDIDLLSDVSYVPEREEYMFFSDLPMGTEEYFLFISQANREISSMDPGTLKGKKIGVNAGSVQKGYFLSWAAGKDLAVRWVEPEEAETAQTDGTQVTLIGLTCPEEESIRQLAAGELDGYITVDSFALNAQDLQAKPVPAFRIEPPNPSDSDFYFAVSKNSRNTDPEKLIRELNSAMLRIQNENPNYNQQLADRNIVSTGTNALLTPEEISWLEHHGTIRIGYQDNYLAFCTKDPETGEVNGALKEYLEYAAGSIANAQVRFQTTAYPTAEAAIKALQNGEIDCMFPANLSAGDGEALKDKGGALFMTPPLMRTDVFAVVRQKDRQIFSDRSYVMAAVNEGNPNYISCLYDSFPEWQYVTYPTTADCLKAVSQGVADCVLISSYRYNNIARQCEQLNLTTVATPAQLDYCFAVAAREPELYSIMTKVTYLVPESTVNAALSHYIAEDAKSTLWDFIEAHRLLVFAVIGAVLLLILILMIRSLRAEKKAAKLISATETDPLTGLYNRDYFLQYAGSMQREHPGTPMDAIVMNIDRFHALNALNGRDFGDQVLQTLGSEIHAAAKEKNGIAGRFEADRFDIYCCHGDDYQALYDRLQEKLNEMAPAAGIRLRMGVMPWAEGQDVVQMFDRARTACSMARGSYSEHLIVYDEKMQERENYEQRLLNDLHRALNFYEFEVYYQPQFDIQCDPPKLVSAEALVRWNHPEFGMIPPNDFIPLLEQNGKIGEMDQYVWSEAVRQIARWRDLYAVTIPVSVNLSRVDVFDPALESALEKLLAYNGLGQGMMKLEVTESAYTGNADQVIRVVEGLRRKGYVVEMDDFGTGYSSLNMLSAMPVDVLKMDRAFIRKISESEKDAHLVGLILGIAKSLKIPVVAEGVETEEQVRLLRELGCSLVQGYYFGRPQPAAEFEEQVIRNMQSSGPEQAQ